MKRPSAIRACGALPGGLLVARLGDRLEIHCGGPANALLVLGLGGTGFMGVDGNFSPRLVASVLSSFESGDTGAQR